MLLNNLKRASSISWFRNRTYYLIFMPYYKGATREMLIIVSQMQKLLLLLHVVDWSALNRSLFNYQIWLFFSCPKIKKIIYTKHYLNEVLELLKNVILAKISFPNYYLRLKKRVAMGTKLFWRKSTKYKQQLLSKATFIFITYLHFPHLNCC